MTIKLNPGESFDCCVSPLCSDFGDPRDPETRRKFDAWRNQNSHLFPQMVEDAHRRQFPERYKADFP